MPHLRAWAGEAKRRPLRRTGPKLAELDELRAEPQLIQRQKGQAVRCNCNKVGGSRGLSLEAAPSKKRRKSAFLLST